MRITKAEFAASVTDGSVEPEPHLPEVAVAGKSNVGKSSLINALANNRKLARVGATPGKTRLINYYRINDRFYIVDLPGYGFATAPKAEREKWSRLVDNYFSEAKRLRHALLLVDVRHSPTADDKLMAKWLVSYSLPFTVVLTKCDKIAKSQHRIRAGAILAELGLPEGMPVVYFSAQDRRGTDELSDILERVLPKD